MTNNSHMDILIGLKTAIYGFVAGVFLYLDIPHEQATILGILMVFDMITGVMKQYSIDPQLITSHRAWLGIMKKIGTFIFLLTIGLVFKVYGNGLHEWLIIVISVLCVAEAYSITQNVYTLRTGKKMTEYDAISSIIKGIGTIFELVIEGSLKRLHDKLTDKNGK